MPCRSCATTRSRYGDSSSRTTNVEGRGGRSATGTRNVTREAFLASGNTEVATADREAVVTAIRRGEDTLTLVDLGSVNGTHLNGQRLVPNQPRVLRDGDEIRLGRLVVVAPEKSG